MNYWLVKFAPFRYSWQDTLRNGKFEIYSVRNAQARNNLKAMKLNDEVLFYHSQKENCIMGKMKVSEEAHQDKTTTDPRWVSVTFQPVASCKNPVTITQIKKHPHLQTIRLITQPRLAVMELSKPAFEAIVEMGGS
jgi:predicted RNA-binding protein with PUA-like domain